MLKYFSLNATKLKSLFYKFFPYVALMLQLKKECFNGFLIITSVRINILGWFLVEMRKKSYVEFKHAFAMFY